MTSVFKAINSINYPEQFLEKLLGDYKLPDGNVQPNPLHDEI